MVNVFDGLVAKTSIKKCTTYIFRPRVVQLNGSLNMKLESLKKLIRHKISWYLSKLVQNVYVHSGTSKYCICFGYSFGKND